jgi:hypothetical protein
MNRDPTWINRAPEARRTGSVYLVDLARFIWWWSDLSRHHHFNTMSWRDKSRHNEHKSNHHQQTASIKLTIVISCLKNYSDIRRNK